MATIDNAGREYVTWTMTDAPDGVDIEVSTDDGETWHPTTRDGDTIRALFAGPDAEDNPEGTIVVGPQRTRLLARAVDAPEIIVRFAGAIDIT